MVDINARNNEGVALIHLAFQGRADCHYIKSFLDHGADVHARDFNGRSPLHYAVKNSLTGDRGLQSICMLLERGSSINPIDDQGDSVLHYAIKSPDVTSEMIRTLLFYGGFPDFRDKSYCPPLAYSGLNFKPNVENLLIQYTILNKLTDTDFKEFEEKCNRAEELLSLHFCQNVIQRNKWTCFRDECIKEIMRMRFDEVSSDYTLYDCISRNCFKRTKESEIDTDTIDKVFKVLIDNKYPSWRNIIHFIIVQHNDFNPLDKVPNLKVYTVKPVSGMPCSDQNITLDKDSVFKLAKFLPRPDVINLVIAFSHGKEREN